MFIQTESTPNPSTVKFLPGMLVMQSGVAEFSNKDEAARSPLAERIFEIPGVQSVFFGREFVSVTKDDTVEWGAIKAPILGAVMQHFSMGEPRFIDENYQAGPEDDLLDEISKQIKELIDTRVRRPLRRMRRYYFRKVRAGDCLPENAGSMFGMSQFDDHVEKRC